MALRPYPGFVGPSYTSQSKIAAYDRTVNWYPERIESGTGVATYVLYPCPGYQTLLTLGTSPGRGSLSNGDQGYFVMAGAAFYSGFTFRGSVSNITDSPTYMITNGQAGSQVLIASDNNTYAYNINTQAFASVGSGVSVSYPMTIGFLDTYGLRLDPSLSQVGFSAPNDFTSWDALDVFRREDAPDRWVRLLVFHNEVWLYGDFTSSVYYHSEDADTPFQPITSVSIPIGIMAVHSACVVDGSPMWIGQSADGWGIVYRANGYTPERISTHAVELSFQDLSRRGLLQLGEGSTYQENGHVFYELTFPSSDTESGATWVYDSTAGLWHERGVWDGLQFVNLDTRSHFTNTGGDDTMLTLSRTSGKIYQQSTAFYTGTDGLGITRLRRAPHINEAQLRTRFSRFRLLMEAGLGLASGQGSDPQITLRWSDDGGQTFGSAYTVSAGKIGEFSTLVEWWQLGQARDRIFEVTCSDPVPFRLIDAFLDYSVGPS